MMLGTFMIFLLYSTTFQVLCASSGVLVDETVDDTMKEEELEKHILKGTSIYENEYVVYFKLKGRLFCSGTLISEQYVLTAATCFVSRWRDDVTVTIGSVRLSDAAVTLKITGGIFIHPRYDYPRHDIALVKLPKKLTEIRGENTNGYNRLTDKISKIDIIPVKLTNSILPWNDGFEANISGWGETSSSTNKPSDELKVGRIEILPRQQCDDLSLDRYYQQMDPYKICSMGTGNAACFGDLGGPVTAVLASDTSPAANSALRTHTVEENPTEVYQIGIITTWRKENRGCVSGELETFTFVPPYYDWIRSVVMVNDHLDSLMSPLWHIGKIQTNHSTK